MKTFNKNLLWVSIAALALTGCGSSDNNSSDTTDEHEHDSSVLVSQSNTSTLSLFEEGELEALDDAAAGNATKLILSETGAYAAVLSTSTVNFVHGLHEEEEESGDAHEEEAHVLAYSLSGTDISVVPTSGHFAVLVDGDTTFIEYDELANETPATESTSGLSVNEVYPALILDEVHDLKLVFDDTNAKVFEGTTEELSFACANPTSHAQTSELIIISCTEGAVTLLVEEGETEHELTPGNLSDLDGGDSSYIWRAQGHVIVGFEPSTKNYAIVELDESGATPSIVVVKSSDTGTYAFTQNICNLVLDTDAQDILAISAAGSFVVLNHEAEMLKSITLDESAASSCDDFVMAGAAKMALVIDNKAQKGYEIDVDEPSTNANGYHVHERFDLSVSDVASMVIFHEVGEEAGDHAH